MVKEEFVREVAQRSGLKQVDVSRSLENGIDVISEQLQMGKQVVFRGFGCFDTKKRQARTGRDWSGEKVYIPPDVMPVFKPGKGLRESVSQGAARNG